MKRLIIAFTLFSLVSCTKDRNYPSTEEVVENPNSLLVYYWNFNSGTGNLSNVSPDFSLVANSNTKINYLGTGTSVMDSFSPAYTNNLRKDAVGGSGLRARNPSNTKDLIIALPTTNFKNIIIKFATARSGSGATTQNYSYTIDGTNYINTDLNKNTFNPLEDPTPSTTPPSTTPVEVSLVSLDFRNIAGANDNPNFKLKISFAGATASGTSGNNRFDNISLDAEPK